jgi:hypothetical protein
MIKRYKIPRPAILSPESFRISGQYNELANVCESDMMIAIGGALVYRQFPSIKFMIHSEK